MDFRAQRWLGEFLARRHLERATGNPLYTYRCSPEELKGLRALLAEADLANDKGRHLSAGFVLFAAETFRTAHLGGVWTWRTVLEPLGLKGTTQLCEPVKTRGLKWWGRDGTSRLRSGARHLFALVAECGFPVGLLSRDNGAVRAWLMRVQGFVNEHAIDVEDAAEVAETYAYLIADSLRSNELFALAAELTCTIRELRHQIGPIDESADPILILQQLETGWRDRLPINLDDEAARVLFRGLMRATSATAAGADQICHRVLIREADSWRPALRWAEAGRFRIDQMPRSVVELLDDGVFRGRLIASGHMTSTRDGEIAVIERGDEQWTFRSVRRSGTTTEFPLAESVSLMLRVGNRHSTPFVISGGAAVLDEILVFARAGEGELQFLGSGGQRVRGDELWVALDPQKVSVDAPESATLEHQGCVQGGIHVMYRLSGSVTSKSSDGLTVRLATGVTEPSGRRVHMIPRPTPVPVSPDPASAGLPAMFYAGGLNVAAADVRWRPVTGGRWHSLAEAAPCGAVQVAIVRDGELIDRFRIAVLPRDARIDVIPSPFGGGEIRLKNFGPCRVAVTVRDGVSSSVRHGQDAISISVQAPANIMEFDVTIMFEHGGPITLHLPVPHRGVAFIDRSGIRLSNKAELAVNDLAGVRVLADDGRLITVELRAVPPVPLGFVTPVGQGLSLATTASDCRTLLSETSDADARVILEGEGARLVVKRYAFELARAPDGSLRCDIGQLQLPSDAILKVVAHRLTDPQAGEITIWSGPSHALSEVCICSPDPSTPWLTWVEHSGRAISRPGLLPSVGDPPDGDAFAACAFISGMAPRKTAMADHLIEIAATPGHADWGRLRAALKLCQGRVPLASLDWFTVIARLPKALAAFLIGSPADMIGRVLETEQELPFLWETIPVADWIAAAEAQRRWLSTLLGQDAQDVVLALMGDVLAALHRGRPHLWQLVWLLSHSIGLTGPAAAPPPAGAPIQGLLQRNADRQWPVLDPILSALPRKDLDRYGKHTHSVILAPHLAAAIMAGMKADEGALLALRTAKRFDQTYFESAFAALRPGA
nr:STY4851/ECs_5259 family protein [Microvirga splendida]